MDESAVGADRRRRGPMSGAGRTSYDDLLADVRRLTEANEAQASVISALLDAAEQRQRDLTTRLGTQHVVEQRTARLHHAERVLRSVIEALDGALCIVGCDGTVVDANRRWPGPVGSDFFDWCRSTPDLGHLLTAVADLVRAVLDADPDQVAGGSREVKDRSGPSMRLGGWFCASIPSATTGSHAPW